MKAVKHLTIAGVVALAALVAPVGVAFQWGDQGPSVTGGKAVSTVYAAPSRPIPKKPPSGGPTFTSSGTASKTTGYQSGSGTTSDETCQGAADAYDHLMGQFFDAPDGSDRSNDLRARALRIESAAADAGCVFIYGGPNGY